MFCYHAQACGAAVHGIGLMIERKGFHKCSFILIFVTMSTNALIDDNKDIFLTKQNKRDLIEKMNKDKIYLIKWMFGFWITIILMLLANWFLK